VASTQAETISGGPRCQRLGEILIGRKLIETEDLEKALELQKERGDKLGKILVGDKGMTLYIFTKDVPDQSNCSGDCLKKWPPLKTLGKPNLGAGVDASLISTASLPDGSMILTYNKMPLYYFAGDAAAGDVKGEGVGSVWFVISPLGKVIPLPAPIPTPKPKKNNGMGGGYTY